jgi:pimeloyl-ACP methyl ester carboxylesterase
MKHQLQGYTLILIHGAFHGGWCWSKLTPLLEEQGARVVAPTLPYHEKNVHEDQTTDKLEKGLLKQYVQFVIDIIEKERCENEANRIVLVCHSVSGIVGTRVGEKIPDCIHAIVFLSAYVVKSFESVVLYAHKDKKSELVRHMEKKKRYNRLTIPADPEILKNMFYNDCSKEDSDYAIERLCLTDALLPMLTPVKWTNDKFGSIPHFYICTGKDNALSLDIQEEMISNTKMTKVYFLYSGHSPFFSVPDRLAAILSEIIMKKVPINFT